jgi:hypothetical protein
MSLNKTVSTFETFMNNNKMKRKILKMNNDLTNNENSNQNINNNIHINTNINNNNNNLLSPKKNINDIKHNNKKKHFTNLNSPPAFHNKIVKNEPMFKNEISAISPNMYPTKRKEVYLSDIMQTKYSFGYFNKLQRENDNVLTTTNNDINYQNEDEVSKYMKGFKYKMTQPIRPLKLVKPSFMFK